MIRFFFTNHSDYLKPTNSEHFSLFHFFATLSPAHSVGIQFFLFRFFKGKEKVLFLLYSLSLIGKNALRHQSPSVYLAACLSQNNLRIPNRIPRDQRQLRFSRDVAVSLESDNRYDGLNVPSDDRPRYILQIVQAPSMLVKILRIVIFCIYFKVHM